MEEKKSKKADLNRNSGLYFVLGLALVMLLVWGALEWKTYDEANDYDISLNVEDMLDEEVPPSDGSFSLPLLEAPARDAQILGAAWVLAGSSLGNRAILAQRRKRGLAGPVHFLSQLSFEPGVFGLERVDVR